MAQVGRQQRFAIGVLIAVLVAACAGTASTPSTTGAATAPGTVAAVSVSGSSATSGPIPAAISVLPSQSGLAPAEPAANAPKTLAGPTSKPATTAASGTSAARVGEPLRGLTPGATNPTVTQATIGSTICVSGWTATIRPPASYTTALKRTQIVAYGYADRSLADYEEDHLISLEIGGAPRDPANLWPEPYVVSLPDGTPVGARVKDQLENTLKRLVCARSITLAKAQSLIRRDWIAAWRTYVVGGSTGTAVPAPTATPSATPGPTTPPASGTVRVAIASLTSPAGRGSTATLVAQTTAGAACSIVVLYKSGPSSAAGLGPKNADGSGAVTWSWTVGTRTTPGSWPVTVRCTSGDVSASATQALVVQ